jgi:hypothetical protein
MPSGRFLYLVLAVLGTWFTFLLVTFWRLLNELRLGKRPGTRQRLTTAGIALSGCAVGSLLLLHLTWLSSEVSQRFGIRTVTVLSLCILAGTILGCLLSVAGAGKMRFIGISTCLLTGLWWISFSVTAGISGAVTARHPIRYLVPDGYIGWVEIKHGEKGARGLPLINGAIVCKVPASGLLETSSALELGSAKDEYFYYTDAGSTIALKSTGWGQGGMIWAPTDEWIDNSEHSRVNEYFFVGKEEQYHHLDPRSDRRPFNQAATTIARP